VGDAETATTDEQQQAFALLTDSEVGLDPSSAAVLARKYPLRVIAEQVFRFIRDRAAGSVRSPAVIPARFAKQYAPGPVLSADKQSELWRRHFYDADPVTGDTAEDLVRRYAMW
jgi:hypothetical protein